MTARMKRTRTKFFINQLFKMKKILLFFVLILIITDLSAQKRKRNQAMGTFLLESQFKDYIPVSPLEFEQNVIIYDSENNRFDTLAIKQLAANKASVLQFLPNEAVYATVRKNDNSADIKYGPASITAEAGSYTVTLDYCKFTTLKIIHSDGKSCAGFSKVGIGMRITAQITTFQAGVDVSSLFGLGIAAKTNKLSGQLSVDLIGMESSKITDLITLPVDISEASIQSALQSLSAIKSKIYDENTRLYPQIIAIKRADGSCSVFDILNSLDQSGQNTIKIKNPALQQQQQERL